FRIETVTSGFPELPAGLTARSPIYAFTPHGQVFRVPATVVVPLPQPATGSLQLLTAALGGQWGAAAGARRTTEAYEAMVDHLSFFVIAGRDCHDGEIQCDDGCVTPDTDLMN